jgi:hypothetical protein
MYASHAESRRIQPPYDLPNTSVQAVYIVCYVVCCAVNALDQTYLSICKHQAYVCAGLTGEQRKGARTLGVAWQQVPFKTPSNAALLHLRFCRRCFAVSTNCPLISSWMYSGIHL